MRLDNMKTIKKLMCYILVIFALVAVVACDNGTNDGPGVVESPYGVKIIAVGSVTTLKVGQDYSSSKGGYVSL
jgi:hypothetical protein